MVEDSAAPQDVASGKVTINRNSPADVKTRQLVASIDGEKIATLMWGESVTRELPPGPHRLRVHNTLVWKTIDFTLAPGEQATFEAINRTGKLTYFLVSALGAGPLYVTLRRVNQSLVASR
jgi:hypothetical protein